MAMEVEKILDEISRLPMMKQKDLLRALAGKLGAIISMDENKNREETLAALEAGFGAWTDENHPDLKSIEDIHRWLKEARCYTTRRLERRLADQA